MPLSNLLLVLCPSLSPSLLQALRESQGIWNGVYQREEDLDLDATTGETSQPISFSQVRAEFEGSSQTASPLRSSSEGKRFVRPLPSLPTPDGSSSIPSSSSTGEASGLSTGVDKTSRVPHDTESPSSSSSMDDSSSISYLSQGGRPVTPTTSNFKLANPYSPPSLSCSFLDRSIVIIIGVAHPIGQTTNTCG